MMSPEEKDKIIAKIAGSPQSLSKSEIEAILSDDELRDIYSVAVSLRQASVLEKDYDVDAEWHDFQGKIGTSRIVPLRRIFIAAASVAIIVVSVVSFLLMNKSEKDSIIASKPVVSDLVKTKSVTSDTSSNRERVLQNPEIQSRRPRSTGTYVVDYHPTMNCGVADGEARKHTLATPSHEIVKKYGIVRKRSENTERKMNPTIPMSEKEKRLEQARLDDEEAQNRAEEYLAEYYIRKNMDLEAHYDPENCAIKVDYKDDEDPELKCLMSLIAE